MAELRRRFRLPTEALGDLRILAEVGVKHLDDDASREKRLLGEVHISHAAAAETANDAIAAPGCTAQLRELGVWLLERSGHDLGQRVVAASACRGRSPIPGAAIRTEHASPASRQLPNCMRTKSNGGQGPLTSSARPGFRFR